MKTLNRDKIQRMFGQQAGGAGGSSVNDDGDGVSKLWVEQNYLSKEFFLRLFNIHGEDENDDPVDVQPNDLETTITDIEAMFGFWTEQYLSTLGQNSEQGGGGITLNAALASINNSPLGNPTGTSTVLMFNGTTWVYASMGSTDMNTVWTALADGTDTHQINVSHLTTALGSYFTQGSGISITNTVGGTGKTISLAQIQDLTAGTYKSVTVDQYGRVTAGTNPTTLAGYGITDALASNTTFWGRTIAAGAVKGGIDQASYIEFADIASGTTNGGYIDFHYGGNTTANSGDYTSRIIEDAFDATNSQGTLKINNILWAKLSTGVSIGTSTISSDYKLNVVGYTKTTRLYLAEGVYLEYDSNNIGVHLVGAGFYSDSYVSALGVNSGGGGGGGSDYIPLTGSDQIAGSLIPVTTNAYDLGDSTHAWRNIRGNSIYASNSITTYYLTVNSTATVGSLTASLGNIVASAGDFIASAGHGFQVTGKDDTYVLLAGGGTKLLFGSDGYITYGNLGRVARIINDTDAWSAARIYDTHIGTINSDASGSSNSPFSLLGGNAATFIQQIPYETNYNAQIAFNFASRYLVYRNRENSWSWSDWTKISAGNADTVGGYVPDRIIHTFDFCEQPGQYGSYSHWYLALTIPISNDWASYTYLFQNEFWGGQHQGSFFLFVATTRSSGSAAAYLYQYNSIGTSRDVAYKIVDNVLYVYVKVNGGNGPGMWLISQISGTFARQSVYSFTQQQIDPSGITYVSKSSGTSAGVAVRLETPHSIWGQTFDGTQDVSGDIIGAGSISASGQIVSSLASGTAPLSVTSTTMCTNLNADMLDGLHASAFGLASLTLGASGGAVTYYKVDNMWGSASCNVYIISTRAGESFYITCGSDDSSQGRPLIQKVTEAYTKISEFKYGGGSLYIKSNAYNNSIQIRQIGGKTTSLSYSVISEATYNAATAISIYSVCTDVFTGNVGIGTTTPSYKLHVIGTIYATTVAVANGTSSGFLKANGDIDTNTYALSTDISSIIKDGTTWSKSTTEQAYILNYTSPSASTSNNPFSIIGGNAATVISVLPYNTTYGAQLAFGFGNARLVWRNRYNSTTMSDWVGIIAGSADKLVTSRTLWGQSFDGSANVTGEIASASSLEFTGVGGSAGNGGFIDFHFNGSTSDYTSRIIEEASGTIKINNIIFAKLSDSVGIGTSSPSYKLDVNGTIGLSGTTKKIYFDSTHYIELDSSGYFHFSHGVYSDGFVSALGLNSGGGSSGDYIPLSGSTSITGDLTPSSNNSVKLGAESKRWASVYCTTLRAYGASSIAGNLTMAGNITPTGNNQYALGTSSTQFGNAFVRCARIGHFCIETDTDGNYSSSRSNEINNYNGVIHLQYNSTNGVTLAGGGGNVAVGTTSVNASYKLFVSGSLYCSSFTMSGLSITGNGQRFDINTNNGAANLPVYVTGTWYGTFQNGSDIRLKSIHKNIDSVNVNDLSRAPIFDFTWIDGRDKDLHLGSSAQFWRDIFPNAISTMYDGHYAMDYGATALAAAVITARKVVDHEARIRLLEVENAALRNEINQLKKVA